MDASLADNNTPKQGQKPAIEYTAQAASPLVNGETKLTISDNALTATALFDVAEIPFADINALELADYVVTVSADSGDYVFSRMGNWCQPFYDALHDAYNKAVLRSLFIKSSPILTAKCDYRYTEKNVGASENANVGGNAGASGIASGNAGASDIGSAPVHVYESSVTTLPANLSARRVPLCFVTAMDKGDYELTLRLDTGESYTYKKLGYETAPFASTIETRIRKLHEESLAAVKEIDPGLTAAQASQLAKLMPQGTAAPIGQLSGIAVSFTSALENKIAATRAAESFAVFKELCDPAKIWIGFRKNKAASDIKELPSATAGDSDDMLDTSPDLLGTTPDPYLLWLVAPSPDGQHAAVEFAEADSATFVYRTGGDFAAFARQVNRALEAIDFKREIIRLSNEELQKPENADYFMAAKRTAALQFVRKNFVGRVIHSSTDAWKRKLTKFWGGWAERP